MKNNYELNSLYFYLTWNCNLRCIHCWVDAGNHNFVGIKFEEVQELLEQAMNRGLKHIRFTGGEPTIMWETLVKIIEYTKDRNIAYDMETNLTLVAKEKLEFLQKYNVSLSVSVNGVTAEEHDAFSGCPGAFDKTIAALKLMKNMGYMPNEIITCISKDTIPLLSQRIQFFETLGINKLKINIIQNLGRAENLKKADMLLGAEEQFELTQYIKELQKTTDIFIYLDVPQCLQCFETFQRTGFNSCGIYNMLCVLPDKKISMCGHGSFEEELILCDIHKGIDLDEIWENHTKLKQLRTAADMKLEGVCKKCIHFLTCRGSCRVLAYRENKTWNVSLPLCQQLYDKGLFPESRLIK